MRWLRYAALALAAVGLLWLGGALAGAYLPAFRDWVAAVGLV